MTWPQLFRAASRVSQELTKAAGIPAAFLFAKRYPMVIFSSTGRGCNNFVEIGRVVPNTTTYPDGTVASNTQYSYRMRAFNTGGVSSYTNVVSAKTPRR